MSDIRPRRASSLFLPILFVLSVCGMLVGLTFLILDDQASLALSAVAIAVLALALTALRKFRVEASDLTIVAVAVLLLFPGQFRVTTLGAIGTPGILIGLACLGLWLVGLVFRRPWIAPRLHPIRWAMVGLALSVCGSYIAAGFRTLDPVELRAADRGLVTLVVMAGMALLVADTLRTRLQIRRLVQVIVVCGAFVSLLGVIEFQTGADIASIITIPGFTFVPEAYTDERAGFVRIVSTTTNPLELSVVLAMLLPLGLYLGFTNKGWRRKFWFAAAAATALAIPMTVSRTGVLAVAAAGAVLLFGWCWRRRLAGLLVALIGLVALRFVVPGLIGTLGSFLFTPGGDPSIQSRERGIDAALAVLTDQPLLGRGFATFIPERYVFIDNQVLLSLVETGLVGVLALFVVFGTAAVLGLGVRREAAGPLAEHDRELALALLASLAAAVATLVTYDAFSFPTSRGLTFAVIGCLAALWRITRERSQAVRARSAASALTAPRTAFEASPRARSATVGGLR